MAEMVGWGAFVDGALDEVHENPERPWYPPTVAEDWEPLFRGMPAVEDAARALIAATQRLAGATDSELLNRLCERDMAFHDLLVAVGDRCDCEPGTCPSAPAEDVDVAGEVL